MAHTKITAVDVFCGVAGLSLGLKNAGIGIAAGIDLDPACRYPFEKNIAAPFLERDVADLTAGDIRKLFGTAQTTLLAGCAPCQPFSGYTTRRRAIDGRWQLLLEFLRLAKSVRPDIVTMENVPRLVQLPLWKLFVGGLTEAGYHVAWDVVDAAGYRVPQNRRRLVLIASRLGEVGLPNASSASPITVRDAIGMLPRIGAGVRNGKDMLHSARALTPRNLKRIQISKPDGTWRDWPRRMQVDCHKEQTGKTYPSVYGRMSWERCAPTITTQFYGYGNGRFGHPEQDRALTLREGAILQSFPRDFQFVPAGARLNFRSVGRLIGNAVPPELGKAIGKAIVAHVESAARAVSGKTSRDFGGRSR